METIIDHKSLKQRDNTQRNSSNTNNSETKDCYTQTALPWTRSIKLTNENSTIRFQTIEQLIIDCDIKELKNFIVAHHNKFNLHETGSYGSTLAHALARNCYHWSDTEIMESFEAMLHAGFNFTQRNIFGETPCMVGFRNNGSASIQVALEKGLISNEEINLCQMNIDLAHCFSIPQLSTSDMYLMRSDDYVQQKRLSESVTTFFKQHNSTILHPTLYEKIINTIQISTDKYPYDVSQLESLPEEDFFALMVDKTRHLICFVSQGDIVAICNSGAGSQITLEGSTTQAIQFYHKSNIIKEWSQWRDLLENDVEQAQKREDCIIVINGPNQKADNCTWISPCWGFFAKIFLVLAKDQNIDISNKDLASISEITKKTSSIFQAWQIWDKLELLKKYKKLPTINDELWITCNWLTRQELSNIYGPEELYIKEKEGSVLSEEECKKYFKKNPNWFIFGEQKTPY